MLMYWTIHLWPENVVASCLKQYRAYDQRLDVVGDLARVNVFCSVV